MFDCIKEGDHYVGKDNILHTTLASFYAGFFSIHYSIFDFQII